MGNGSWFYETSAVASEASGTATVVASGDSQRWHMLHGIVNVSRPGVTADAVLTLYETDASGTISAVIDQFYIGSSPVSYPFNCGEGRIASATESRIAMAVTGSDVSCYVSIGGYRL